MNPAIVVLLIALAAGAVVTAIVVPIVLHHKDRQDCINALDAWGKNDCASSGMANVAKECPKWVTKKKVVVDKLMEVAADCGLEFSSTTPWTSFTDHSETMSSMSSMSSGSSSHISSSHMEQ